MSWESSALYYRWINEGAKERLGDLHSAQTLMYSLGDPGPTVTKPAYKT